MKKRIFALVLTVLFIVAAVPVAGVGETPEGYDEHDYWKIRNFLEIADENNIKNGNKISENYSPYDPTTWTGTDSNGYSTECVWTSDGHLRSVYFQASDVVGELDVSGCTKLYTLAAYENRITGFDVSGCNELYTLTLNNNQISTANVRDLPVCRLCLLAERTPEEAALALGRPVKTVYTQLSRGRKLLREALERSGNDDMLSP